MEEFERFLFGDDMGSYSPYYGLKLMLAVFSPIILPIYGTCWVVKKIKDHIVEKRAKGNNIIQNENVIENDEIEQNFDTSIDITPKYSYKYQENRGEEIFNNSYEDIDKKDDYKYVLSNKNKRVH